ncbi:MAG TPA: sulfur carrier protein ThiS [Candidatus Acidoferrales bacterium]|nr:sulfur carrier protein ThiS [Candidatus Acidoferrales bacterium]
MQVVINGEGREIPDSLNIEELLRHLNLRVERVAVERNREIVKRERWRAVRLESGDRLEIVHFVGGG